MTAILGLGCDLVDRQRIEEIFARGQGATFVRKITGRAQKLSCEQASREFAVREAAHKAIAVLDATYTLASLVIDWEQQKIVFVRHPELKTHFSWSLRFHHVVAVVVVES